MPTMVIKNSGGAGRERGSVPLTLLNPARIWTRDEVLAHPSPVPKEPGVYAWFFRTVPPGVPKERCARFGDLTLLYIGIAPKAPPQNRAVPSKQRLFHRIRYHYQGNAEGSTLRLTLGCLLADDLGIRLRRVGSGHRLTFADGERALSKWMQENAFVAWVADPQPWLLEKQAIRESSLPLNLDMNKDHQFHTNLSGLRSRAKSFARALPIWETPKTNK